MFERYDERARRTLFFSRYEASQLGSVAIEPEHVLLGILRKDSGAASILTDAGVQIDGLRTELEAATPFKEKLATSVEIPFSPACKHVLQYAAEEADALGHRHIGSEHLLLGILREGKSAAAQLLDSRGMSLAAVRDRLAAGPAAVGRSVEVPGVDHPVEAEELKRRIKAVRDALDDLERFLLGRV